MPVSSMPIAEPIIPTPQPHPLKWLVMLCLFSILIFGSTIIWFLPGLKTIPLDLSEPPTLIWQGEKLPPAAVIIQDEQLYFHIPLLQSLLDPNIFWDKEENYLAVSTKDQLIQMNSQQLTWHINQEPVNLRFPVIIIDEEPYLDLEPLQFLYQLNINYLAETNRVVVNATHQPIIKGETINSGAILRVSNSIRTPRLTKLEQAEELIIIKEENNWLKVQTTKGLIGYLPKSKLSIQGISWNAPPLELEKPPWRPLGGKVNLVWEQVTNGSRNPKLEVLSSLEGINAYSPTWFHLADEQGNINSYASASIVEKAHQEGRQVWALFSNSFDPSMTAQFLNNPEARNRAIRQLILQAQLYNLDGINIDFENIPAENKDILVQFVRELAPMLREQGLVVSMDVTFKSNSGSWSQIYDRKALGEAVDYLMVMAYDEHWATSPVPGSVASLPWVEKGLQAVLEEVPPEKVILGIPLYARLWTVSPDNETNSVTSKAWSMNQTQKWLKENQLQSVLDPATGQHFAELKKDGNHYLLWLEDDTSIQKRVNLVHKYGLAGVATWQRGFAKAEIWPALATHLEQPEALTHSP